MEGTLYKRKVGTLVDKLSLIGGFITTLYYATFYTYLFLTMPHTTLKLAQTFDCITQNTGCIHDD